MTDERTAYNGRIEALRDREYPMLKDEVYLDHAGTTLYAKSLVDKFAADMTSNLFGNPHSGSASSQLSMSRIEDIRVKVLRFFNADPSDFDVVFLANATAAVKLVTEAFRSAPDGFYHAYHQACHTSLVGVRQEARNSLCLDDVSVGNWLDSGLPPTELEMFSGPKLVAYPAQSNMDGRRFPLDWSSKLRPQDDTRPNRVYTLLDAAAFAATSPLDLGNSEKAPDFTVLSFYKIFGFPDLGGLIVRRQAESIFGNRKYFGGGTVDMVVCVKEQWHASKTQSLHESLEDGTLPIHSIIALDSALDVHQQLFSSMNEIALHTSFIATALEKKLAALQHGNGVPVCIIYSPQKDGDSLGSGPTIAFNIQNHFGAWVSLAEFEKLATLKQFHTRTGGLCNPGGIATALKLEPWEIRRNFSSGFRCGNEDDIIGGKPTGVIRVSLGPMSTMSDVDKFVEFVDEFYRTEDVPELETAGHTAMHEDVHGLYVESIMVYPIKSCGGYRIPKGVYWEVRPEGLAWDREWCLVHRGTGQALSQKRYPRMALLRPILDFAQGALEVTYRGDLPSNIPLQIFIPLSAKPDLFRSTTSVKVCESRVCGEAIHSQIYTSVAINEFFSNVLGVPCALVRFPPGGQGKSMRHAKAHLQNHQHVGNKAARLIPGRSPDLATPPDSDSENEPRRILLSNESPILAINRSSLEVLNSEISKRGGKAVPADVFRANITIGSSTPNLESFAYSEDHWSSLKIGQQQFKMMGSCRRCHMVCIDQETAIKSQEPFVTLSKTRRFDGKVFFGTHMCHQPSANTVTREAQHPTIQVGDEVFVDMC